VGVYVSMVVGLVSILVGWYSTAYVVVMYKQVKERTDTSKRASANWLWIVAIIGWVMAGLLGYNLTKTYGAQFREAFSSALERNESREEIEATANFTVPSNCGLSIPLPSTTSNANDTFRKWGYEEQGLKGSALYLVASKLNKNQAALGGFVSFKSEDDKIQTQLEDKEESSFEWSFPGLNILCTENKQGWDLETYVEMALEEGNVDKTRVEDVKWGEIDLVFIRVEGVVAGNFVAEPLYLGIAGNGSRLLQITPWGASGDDEARRELDNDVELIKNGLKDRDVSDTPLGAGVGVTTGNSSGNSGAAAAPAAASCKPVNIREGEFASNKCYAPADYDDLIYYIRAFDRAVFDHNGAVGKANVTCQGFTESFAQSCEEAKATIEKAKGDMDNYRNTINSLIAKGK